MLLHLLAPALYAAAGDGLPVGNAVLTPQATLGVEYASNPYRQSEVTAGEGASNVRASVGAELTADQPETVVLFAGRYDARKFVTADDSRLDRFNDVRVNASVDAFKTGTIGLRATQQLGNVNTPVDAEWSARPFTTQLLSATQAGIAFRPGAAFEIVAGGDYRFDQYSVVVSTSLDERSRRVQQAFGPSATMSWSFLPLTTLIADVEYTRSVWSDPTIAAAELPEVPDSDTVRAVAGIRGRVTERLSVVATAGYGSAAFSDDASGANVSGANGLLMGADVTYQLSADDAVMVGLRRDFRSSYFTSYVSFVRGYLGAETRVSRRLRFSGELGAASEAYRGAEERDDVLLAARLNADINIAPWATLSVQPRWTRRFSSDELVVYSDLGGGMLLEVEY